MVFICLFPRLIMIKSPLRYPGGKSRAVGLINTIIPMFDEYREPFVGGASIFFSLRQQFPNKQFWINDIYQDLYLFWKEVQNDAKSVVDRIYYWKNRFSNGKELHRYLVDNKNTFDDFDKAVAFFIFNRITFSGTTESGGFSQAAFEGRFTDSSILRLLEVQKLLGNATITNIDYQQVVETKGDNVFIFLDPPYYSATKSALYGKNGRLHKIFDHHRFAEIMFACKHKWLITYDDSDFIRNLFSFANITPFNLMYGMRNQTKNSDQKGKEIFISNYYSKDNSYSNELYSQSLFGEPNVEYKNNAKTQDLLQ